MISGPSGVGKSTVGELVLERADRLVRSVSLTTRAPRRGEVDGREYRFIERAGFEELSARGKLLEWAVVHGNLYGTDEEWVRQRLAEDLCVLLEIDVQGGGRVKRRCPDAVLVFLLPPAWDELERRLRRRETDSKEEIARRLDGARSELAAAPGYDYLVVNDDLERCVGEVLAIVASERLKTGRAVLGGPGAD